MQRWGLKGWQGASEGAQPDEAEQDRPQAGAGPVGNVARVALLLGALAIAFCACANLPGQRNSQCRADCWINPSCEQRCDAMYSP